MGCIEKEVLLDLGHEGTKAVHAMAAVVEFAHAKGEVVVSRRLVVVTIARREPNGRRTAC